MLRSGSSSEIHNKYIDLNIDAIGRLARVYISKDHLVGRVVNLTTATM